MIYYSTILPASTEKIEGRGERTDGDERKTLFHLRCTRSPRATVRQTPGGEHERKPQRKRTRRLPRRTSRTNAGGGAKTIRNGDAVESKDIENKYDTVKK